MLSSNEGPPAVVVPFAAHARPPLRSLPLAALICNLGRFPGFVFFPHAVPARTITGFNRSSFVGEEYPLLAVAFPRAFAKRPVRRAAAHLPIKLVGAISTKRPHFIAQILSAVRVYQNILFRHWLQLPSLA
jgi:hypothetical protein